LNSNNFYGFQKKIVQLTEGKVENNSSYKKRDTRSIYKTLYKMKHERMTGEQE